MLLKHYMETGAYELLKVAKERVTCIPLKTRRTGMNLYFDVTRVYMVVAHSFATFGGSYIMVLIKNYLEKKLQIKK